MEDIGVFRIVAALIFVLALVLLAGTVARRLQAGKLAGKWSAGRRLVVSEQLYLSPKHKLLLVRCDEREHLLLLGPQGERVIESQPRIIKEPADA